MSDTPKTDALREVVIGQYKEDELTGNGMGNILAVLTDIETLERERNKHHEDADAFLDKWSKAQERAIGAERERDSERALADQLAEGLRKMVLYSEALILRIQDRSDINFKTLNECIDLFNEWKEARND